MIETKQIKRAIDLEPGDIIDRVWYGRSEVLQNLPSGQSLRKLAWKPLRGNVPNPTGMDYVPNDAEVEVFPTEKMSPELMLRQLHKRFIAVTIYKRVDGRWGIEARRPLVGDSRDYAPYAWAPTVAEAIRNLWEKA